MLGRVEGVPEETSEIATHRAGPPLDIPLARVAWRQHGIVGLAQLRALGLSSSGVRDRVAGGTLHRVHRGVYAVGVPLLAPRARWMAAVLAYGDGAALSHRSSAALAGLRTDRRAVVDISVPRQSARSRPGIRAHACLRLDPADVTIVDGIRCTTVARTLLDLAEVIDRRGLERAIGQAEVLRVFDRRAVARVLTRAAGRRGAALLRAVLDADAEPALTESELEEEFLELCEMHDLPRPEVAVWIATGEGHLKADFAWRAQGLAVETNGYAFHGHRGAFESDHRREGLLNLAGWKVRRFTWRQVTREGPLVAAVVGAALAEGGAAGPGAEARHSLATPSPPPREG